MSHQTRKFLEKIEFYPSFIEFRNDIPIIDVQNYQELLDLINGKNGFVNNLLAFKKKDHIEYGYLVFVINKENFILINYFTSNNSKHIKDNYKFIVNRSVEMNENASIVLKQLTAIYKPISILGVHQFAKKSLPIEFVGYLSKISSSLDIFSKKLLRKYPFEVVTYMPDVSDISRSILNTTSETFFWGNLKIWLNKLETSFISDINKILDRQIRKNNSN